jgi:hypothetical protein
MLLEFPDISSSLPVSSNHVGAGFSPHVGAEAPTHMSDDEAEKEEELQIPNQSPGSSIDSESSSMPSSDSPVYSWDSTGAALRLLVN